MSEPEKSKIIVLATSHQFQGKNFQGNIDDPCYRKTVEQLIAVHSIDFVFEEAAGRTPTYAEQIAKNRPKALSYSDIDPSRSEREKYGLSAETGAGYPVELWDSPPCIARKENVDSHAAREDFWLTRIRNLNFSSALVICGFAHGLSFSFKLRSDGFDVQTCIHYMPADKLCGHVVQSSLVSQKGNAMTRERYSQWMAVWNWFHRQTSSSDLETFYGVLAKMWQEDRRTTSREQLAEYSRPFDIENQPEFKKFLEDLDKRLAEGN